MRTLRKNLFPPYIEANGTKIIVKINHKIYLFHSLALNNFDNKTRHTQKVTKLNIVRNDVNQYGKDLPIFSNSHGGINDWTPYL
jgi:hypothetical protein